MKEKSDLFFHNVIDVEGNKPADQKPSREINLVANLLMNSKLSGKTLREKIVCCSN